MPSWLINLLLPIVIQGITPILSEYIKKGLAWLVGHVPQPVMVVIASVVSEGVNQASAWLAGASLPPGVGALIAIFLNELGNYFGKQPRTPGVK